MAEYYSALELDGRDWSGGVLRKFSGAAREDLFDFYTDEGAALR
jgi:hypothetical protein